MSRNVVYLLVNNTSDITTSIDVVDESLVSNLTKANVRFGKQRHKKTYSRHPVGHRFESGGRRQMQRKVDGGDERNGAS